MSFFPFLSQLWNKAVPVVRWLCVLLPAIFLGRLISMHFVNIPYLDDFMFLPMFQKAHEGKLVLHDFFMVQMEHRLAFVRALIMLRHKLAPDNLALEHWFTFGFLIITGINVGLLMKKTLTGTFAQWWPVLALASLAIFSPIQYQIVLWAMMFQVACPACFLTTALVALASRRLPIWAKFIVGVLCAVCATLSFASGILVWLLVIPVILFGAGLPQGRDRYYYLGFWLLAFAITIGLYFHELKNEAEGPFAFKQGETETLGRDSSSFFRSPGKALLFILRLSGGHLGRGIQVSMLTASFWVGLISFGLCLAACIYWLVRFKDQSIRERVIPWIAVAGYSVGAACLVAIGRLWATSNGDNAVSPRYTIHAIPLTVALIALGWIAAHDYLQRRPEWRAGILRICTVAITLLLALQSVSWFHGMRFMETWESFRLRMATNTMFYKMLPNLVVPGIQVTGDISPNYMRARAMDDMGWLNPKMVKEARLDQFKMNKSSLGPSTAEWKRLLINTEDGMARVEGYASLGGRSRVADAVFLTYKDSNDQWIIFAVTQVEALPMFLAETLARDVHHLPMQGNSEDGESVSSFVADLKLDTLPKGNLELSAWAFDYKKQTAYPINGRFLLDTVNGKARALEKEQGKGAKKAKP